MRTQPSAPLVALHQALAALERGERRHVAVLQIGDSHTAADHFSGRLRTLLQQRFGNAGRGLLPPGAPHDWYRPYHVAVSQTKGWRTLTSGTLHPSPVAFGLSGAVARASDPADTIIIENKSDAPLQTLQIGLIARKSNGALEVRIDGQPAARIVSSDDDGLKVVRVDLPRAARRIELLPAGDGPVEVTDHALIGANPGVSLSNLGFIGAQVSIMSRWYWPRVARQIADLEPALIILAFGTNEGHAPVDRIAGSYAEEFEHRLRALKQAAPGASIVVVGPPDANRYPRYCLPKPAAARPPESSPTGPAAAAPPPAADANASASGSAPQQPATSPSPQTKIGVPPPEPPADAICMPLTSSERPAYDRLIASEDRSLCRWHTPAAIPVVRRIQREVAARNGALFFDWFELFGRECGADQWFRQGLAHKDRVHFKQDGYWRAAEALHVRLLAGYPPKP